MNVYLDAIWTLNFLLDWLLLLITQSLMRDNTKKIRIVIGAFVASFIVPITLYYPHSVLTTWYGKLGYSLVIILCTFKFSSVYRLLKIWVVFYFISFAIGGGLIGVHYLLHSPMIPTANGLVTFNQGYGDPISWLFVIIGFPTLLLFTKRRMDKHGVDKIRFNQMYPVSIQIKQQVYSTTGYIDSGNQLIDPLTQFPVVICDESFLKQWFTNEEWEMIKRANDSLNMDLIPINWQELIHIVPYQGVDGNHRFLMAIRPKQLIIEYNGKRLTTNRLLIGVQFAHLTSDRSYQCLLQPHLINFATDDSA